MNPMAAASYPESMASERDGHDGDPDREGEREGHAEGERAVVPRRGVGHRGRVIERRAPGGAALGGGGLCRRRSAHERGHRLLDRHADEAAPLRPGAVVVADVGEAEQLVEHEPGVAGALADAAVGDDVLVRR